MGPHLLVITVVIKWQWTLIHGYSHVQLIFGQALKSWVLGRICYAVCHIRRCCSLARYATLIHDATQSATYVTAVVQCLYQLNELSVPIFFITSKPGAGLQSITNLAKGEITALTNIDMFIVCGGSNDVNRGMSYIGLNTLEKFGNLRTNTKILILALQPRHDLVQDSDGYTRRGQHFHSTGKSKVVQYIVQYLTKFSTNSNSVSITLKWKNINFWHYGHK